MGKAGSSCNSLEGIKWINYLGLYTVLQTK